MSDRDQLSDSRTELRAAGADDHGLDTTKPPACRHCEGTGWVDGQTCGDCCGLAVDCIDWANAIAYERTRVAAVEAERDRAVAELAEARDELDTRKQQDLDYWDAVKERNEARVDLDEAHLTLDEARDQVHEIRCCHAKADTEPEHAATLVALNALHRLLAASRPSPESTEAAVYEQWKRGTEPLRRYRAALRRGLSDAEAREEGWPSSPDTTEATGCGHDNHLVVGNGDRLGQQLRDGSGWERCGADTTGRTDE